MLINGIDISTYKAKQLNVDIQPSNIAISGDWINGSLSPIYLGKKITFKSIKIEMIIENTTRDESMKNISDIISNFTGFADLVLDGYPNNYKTLLIDSSVNKTVEKGIITLNLNLQGYEFGNEITENIKRVTSKVINVKGNLDVPAIIEIIPAIDMINLFIVGLSSVDRILIKNLKQGQKIIINGEDYTILENGLNKFYDADFWEFPCLKPGDNKVQLSSNNCDICVKYKPRFI